MVNIKNVIMSIFVIIMVLCFFVGGTYSQEKPSEGEMKYIIGPYIKNDMENINIFLLKYEDIKSYEFVSFNITNSFFSKLNSRYCIKFDYEMSYEYYTIKRWNVKGTDRRFCFEKKDNRWYGEEGWGPGED